MKTILTVQRIMFFLLLWCLFVSCSKKKNDPEPETETPTEQKKERPVAPVYSGDVSNMSNDTARVGMFKNLMDYAYSANSANSTNPKIGIALDENSLLNKYQHIGNPFSNQTLNSLDNIRISDAVNQAYQDTVRSMFKRIVQASKSTTEGSPVSAGVRINSSGTYRKLFDVRGFAIDELIEKVLMGSLQLFQILQVHLVDSKITSADVNANLKSWDAAFAYLGVPLDYGNKDYNYNVPLWGKYLKINDERLGWNISKIISAFVAGRQGIIEKNNDKVRENARIIKDELEKATAGLVITSVNNFTYYNDRQGDWTVEKNRALSQVLGFLYTMDNIPNRKLSDADLRNHIDKMKISNYAVSVSDVTAIRAKFSSVYGITTGTYIDTK